MDRLVFSYCPSSKVTARFLVKFCFIEYQDSQEPCICTIQLFSGNESGSLMQKCFVSKIPNKSLLPTELSKISTHEWLDFGVTVSELSLNAKFVVSAWKPSFNDEEVYEFVGCTTYRLFDENNLLRQGLQKIPLQTSKEIKKYSPTSLELEQVKEINRLDGLLLKLQLGDVPSVNWLDDISFGKIKDFRSKHMSLVTIPILYLDFLQFSFPVVFQRSYYPKSENRVYYSSFDLELNLDSPAELKHRRLVRSQRNGPLDKDLKPNSKIRKELESILSYPPSEELSLEEKDLIWKFRFYLTRNKKAMTKFLKSVVWTDSSEVNQALSLLDSWTEIDIDDALELLSPSFVHPKVRAYAVSRLETASNEELLLYLLQLVQALRYDNPISSDERFQPSPLALFLVNRAISSPSIGNDLYWYLVVEIEDEPVSKLFSSVMFLFQKELSKSVEGRLIRETLSAQAKFVEKLLRISKSVQSFRGTRLKKIEYLKVLLEDHKYHLLDFHALPLPLDPSVNIVGIIPDACTVFKSTMQPLRLLFKCQDGSKYPIIFKNGDDLRQDQLVIQILTLMDKLLKKEKLDLHLKPYRILATGPTHGAVQFVPSKTLATILAEYHGSVLAYLRENNPDDGLNSANYGIDPVAMDNYVRSCAGYCVITYLLGVGDRHLDNLLITKDGHFFHADFGYILGRDPKLFSPAMKLSKEMVEGMGGYNSPFYQQFKSYCYTTFTALRKSSNLILNLFSLMVDANIPDIKFDKEKVVYKVKERFCLQMSESDAIKYFEQLINDSVSALFPQIIDRMHNLAQYMRS
ncbi:Phosphatidylinositol 3-kinase vps34 [Schizosaccharomyces pombe]|uniref:Phosphatidylinositol 3-kinase pik3 n=1 Tax=Schizosaccharomyces pombe (strain 972 / ATCC 24843) TaxID=284812 RepID=VPS34_SCHPO|nr:phosphatidylinositol 3-kinase Pik3 [Schizosaccharomyces pombe]P50520.2 RecName: Full=Phosphatidylinositol 3-kinase vps34; Short=PI3-kinase vps34; Short=PI3K vps34; Short=PtdIns-3-kinase vps34; AltName: Full=Vacuolar protein sorting-associated protein 34 [Schizosaccharomyces pombe 972h-]CAB93847.1 phosphatidylinositol 3-kinase Pik3 [Schizosaccharomyces pombe]|eukprot:NP_594699.1 phosphatidylinositol 3-kinase Pik3 [Schizosaccharomyces pombe]